MPAPRSISVYGDENLPEKVDVVIIGGGIAGCSTALELAERGIKVALCEKGGIGREQSGQNWGWVRIGCRDTREIPLMTHGLSIWPELEQRTGYETGYKRCGITFWSVKEKEQAFNESWLTRFRALGLKENDIGARLIDTRDLMDMYPNSSLRGKDGLYVSADGRAEPHKVIPALALGARAKGAHILTECAVRGLETAAGRVCGVVTERGTIKCSSVVLAGGLWSNLFLENLKNSQLRFPQLTVLNSVQRTAPVPDGPEVSFWSSDFALRKGDDQGYVIASSHSNIADLSPKSFKYFLDYLPILKTEWSSVSLRFSRFPEEARIPSHWKLDEESPFEYARVKDPVPSRKYLDQALNNAGAAMSVFKNVQIVKRWGGYIDTLPDVIPVISDIPAIPGFFIASGFSGHGFGLGPAAGRLMANLVSGEKPIVDPYPFRFTRFSDGSKIYAEGGL